MSLSQLSKRKAWGRMLIPEGYAHENSPCGGGDTIRLPMSTRHGESILSPFTALIFFHDLILQRMKHNASF